MADAPDKTDAALDDRLRAAMKSLDDAVPPGYFEALPNRILPRLEATKMQTDTTSGNDHDDHSAAPPPTDDSGLHDIRNLAETTKKRLSKKVTAQPMTDDVLASSSGSWRNIALPEPAKMVSLPELAELPTKAEIKAKDKAAKAAKPAEVIAPAASASTSHAAAPVAAVAPIATRAAAPRGNQTRTIALVGLGLAAAAGVALIVRSQSGGTAATDTSGLVAANTVTAPAPAPAPVVAPVVTGAPISPPPAVLAGERAESAAAAPTQDPTPAPPPPAAAQVARAATPAPKHGNVKGAGDAGGKAAIAKPTDKPAAAPVGAASTADAPKASAKPGDPSFDDLLKEAGVADGGGAKKDATPHLDKKSLSGDDITRNMGALASKAQACYKGTQGTASVKMTVAPSGKVTKVTIGGAFAGKPEGQCVAALAQSATFPPWDGGPQTVNYSYLLSE